MGTGRWAVHPSLTWAEHSLCLPHPHTPPSGRGQPMRLHEHPGAQGTGCWHRPTLGGPWDAAVDVIGLSAHALDMQARHPED